MTSVDFGNIAFDSSDANLTVTGYYSGGGQVTQSVFVPVGPPLFTTVSFDSSWSNLTLVEFGVSDVVSGIVLDNVAVNVVPIPAAAWLFGSALLGLGWFRRKQVA